MDWITRLNQALAYIEEHLDGKIELEQNLPTVPPTTFKECSLIWREFRFPSTSGGVE